MSQRAAQKSESRRRILDVASVRLRSEGLGGAGIAQVMRAAGLTHGAFYSHFENKDDLVAASFRHALAQTQPAWFGKRKEAWPARLKRLAKTYLSRTHRDDRGHGCAISALAADMSNADEGTQAAFEDELSNTFTQIAQTEDVSSKRHQEAIAFLSLCVGGITLARAVRDPISSDRILGACRAAVARLGGSSGRI